MYIIQPRFNLWENLTNSIKYNIEQNTIIKSTKNIAKV